MTWLSVAVDLLLVLAGLALGFLHPRPEGAWQGLALMVVGAVLLHLAGT